MIPASTLLWVSIRPLLKMAITVLFGFFLTKRDLFPAVAARGAGQVIINITIPCLLFSKIVPSFNSQNIGALGPLFVIGILYEVIGFLLALLVRQFFWVPHRFRYGILAAGTWGNWSDIPTAVVMSITASAPFGGPGDSDLAVAYVAVFILIFYGTLFPLGGHLLIGLDFKGPDYDDDEVRMSISQKARSSWEDVVRIFERTLNVLQLRKLRDGRKESSPDVVDLEKAKGDGTVQPAIEQPVNHSQASPLPPITDDDGMRTAVDEVLPPADEPAHSTKSYKTPLQRTLRILGVILTPPTVSIGLSFPIALVGPLKRLFISPTSSDPPLSFLYDTANFIGAASVPLGLICLGSALGRMTVPKPWTRLPLGAVGAFTAAKLVVMPVIGVALCAFFTSVVHLINPEDKVLRYVCIFFSSVPTATAQVFLTQVYSPDGGAEHLSAFLVPQYLFVGLTMTCLNAYALHTLFS